MDWLINCMLSDRSIAEWVLFVFETVENFTTAWLLFLSFFQVWVTMLRLSFYRRLRVVSAVFLTTGSWSLVVHWIHTFGFPFFRGFPWHGSTYLTGLMFCTATCFSQSPTAFSRLLSSIATETSHSTRQLSKNGKMQLIFGRTCDQRTQSWVNSPSFSWKPPHILQPWSEFGAWQL